MKWDDLKFFKPFAEIEHTANKLPHWQQPGATYFITFRLGDSTPTELRNRWQAEREQWLLHHPKPWSAEVEAEYHLRFSRQMDQWLDAGYGSCLLRGSEVRSILAGTLQHFDGDRHHHHAWIIMPNHVHCLTTLSSGSKLEQVIKSWKGFSATSINKHLHRSGPLWQEDYFDRLIRDAEHFTNCARYIRRNPQKAKLNPDEFTLFETEFAQRR
ncbi:MAG: transposase [Prosthecobacter sp.]|jgi:putative transposase|uniref:transposase n=1 Tax=Prosthecobacter sp. TaxID=1965333 RepID=UPI0019F649B3|nr:transposase [Prosthecobacter sp.]MBE2283958.1 transposase [Prosthecobacter sp.]